MRCSSYCTAEEYTLNQETISILEKTVINPEFVEKVLHYQLTNEHESHLIDVFLFTFGCIIIWGADEKKEEEILRNIGFVEKRKLKEAHSEFIDFDYNDIEDRTYINEEKNIIILGNDSTLVKLSVSHALAQSVKLNDLEESVINLLKRIKPIQKELAQTGRVSLSRAQLSKQLGELFNARFSINLHSDILDIPEFFWRRPSFEPIYNMTVEFQDIILRQGILNNHLNLIHELYSVLSSDLNHRHSTRLELIIVLLITIEIVLALTSHHNIIGGLLKLFS
ncbi:MAG: RMD1 family protein [Rickettsiaceae bacterium]|nr:RMD1 family protein [Rickettsiaceae bacterium]MCP5377740.1 RMD1 family protein [Rickettsiaceae bacterium]